VARDGQPYGFERFRSDLGRLAPGAGGSADALLRALLDRWRESVGDGPIEDDTTVVVVRREA
jgi:serine phosphatase RsbU (regulator of sigma subunit)